MLIRTSRCKFTSPRSVGGMSLSPTSSRWISDLSEPSIFAGVIGQATWPVGVFAVATNDQDLTFPFSMLALNETACKAIHVSGTGVVEAYGNVQSNSNGSEDGCGGIGLSRTGGGTIDVIADDATCRSAGEIQDPPSSGDMTCTKAPNSFALPDPLAGLDAPAKPELRPRRWSRSVHTAEIQARCPGAHRATPPTETQTRVATRRQWRCLDARIKAWLLSPGLYPAGLVIDNQGDGLSASRGSTGSAVAASRSIGRRVRDHGGSAAEASHGRPTGARRRRSGMPGAAGS